MNRTSLSLWFFAATAIAQLPGQQPPVPQAQPRRIITQQAATEPDSLPGNYVLALTTSEKDKAPKDISIVIGSSSFGVTDPTTSFTGSVFAMEDGLLLIRCSLESSVPIGGSEPGQFKRISVATSVRLRPGANVTIFKNDLVTYQLGLTKLEDSAKK